MTTTKSLEKVTKNELPKCWIKKGNHYHYTTKGVIVRQLPFVSEKYKKLLDLMGIPYKKEYRSCKSNSSFRYRVCLFWDPNLFETEEKELPVYIKASENIEGEDLYICVNEKFKFDLPTSETIRKANDLIKIVLQQIEKYNKTTNQENCWKYVKEILGDSDVAVCMLKVNQKEMELKDENNHIKILQIYNSNDEDTRYYGVFNMQKIMCKERIIIRVPKKVTGLIIGKGGKNKKNWEKALGGEKTIEVNGF